MRRRRYCKTFGYVYAQMDKYDSAIIAFEKCLVLQALPESAALSTMYTTAQLYLAQKKYQKAIAMMHEWFAYNHKVNGDAYILMASAFSELKKHNLALPYAEKAVLTATHPKEHWFTVLISSAV